MYHWILFCYVFYIIHMSYMVSTRVSRVWLRTSSLRCYSSVQAVLFVVFHSQSIAVLVMTCLLMIVITHADDYYNYYSFYCCHGLISSPAPSSPKGTLKGTLNPLSPKPGYEPSKPYTLNPDIRASVSNGDLLVRAQP